MLNGKFYTGLPPGMIERSNTNTQRNRLQSSIFWPDDTKVDSAIETRVKRRNSLQIAQTDRPQLRMQSSVDGNGDTDINTRQLFQKEFSKSSIQFLDNLSDETKIRRPLLLRGNRNASKELTPKPTAMSPTLPENVVNAGYTTAQKKQAFTSKIEFNDYAGDELNNRNNFRRSKMDMNDKREMERNTKNSPKLQVKNNVRNLGGNEKLYTAELSGNVETKNVENEKFKNSFETKPANNMHDEVEKLELEREENREFDYEPKSSAGVRTHLRSREQHSSYAPSRELNYTQSRITVSPEYGYRRGKQLREIQEDGYEISDYTLNERDGAPVRRANSVGRFTGQPKRILKHAIREREYYDDYPNDGYRSSEGSQVHHDRYTTRERDNELYDELDYNEDNANLDYLEDGVRNMNIHRSPRKHVTYSDDTYTNKNNEMPIQSRRPLSHSVPQSRRRPTPNMRNGSNQQRQQQQLQRYNSEMDLVEDVNNELMEQQQTFLENDIHDSETTTTKSNNIGSSYYNNNNKIDSSHAENGERNRNVFYKINNNNNNKNGNTSRLNNQTISSAARKITPKSETNAIIKQNTNTTNTSSDVAGEGGVRKHLRSSLCLHNGEIIASDDGGETSSTKPAPTRNARSMATRQRISVGLPD